MRLSPEAERLRKVARAHAAGEITRGEYRLARRRLIARMQGRPGALLDDITQPRDQTCEVTLRGDAVQSVDTHVLAEKRWPRFATLLLMLIALIGVAANAFGQTVPPVYLRDPNPQTQPRYQVESIDFVPSNPDTAISAAQVQEVLQAALAREQAQSAPADHGFAADELEEIGAYLAAVGVHQGRRLTAANVAELQALIKGQKNRRGLSVTQLEHIAADVESLYVQAGYIATRVYIPAQAIEDGRLALHAQVGALSTVTVTGATGMGIERAFAALVGRPVTRDALETQLTQLNRMPGLQVQGRLQPGDEVGDSSLVVDVLKARRFSGVVTADNFGDRQTGRERLTAVGYWLAPTGRGDQLTVGVRPPVGSDSQWVAMAEYRLPVMRARYDGWLRVSSSDFETDTGLVQGGDSLLVEAGVDVPLTDTREHGVTLDAKLATHQFDWDDVGDQQANFLELGLSGHRTWDTGRWRLDGSLHGVLGRLSDPLPGQDEDFWRLHADVQLWTLTDLPFLPGEQKLVLQAGGQLADTHLPSTLRMGLGGSQRLRGLDRGSAVLDSVIFLSTQYRVGVPVGEVFGFADVAHGTNESDSAAGYAQLSSVGLGWDAGFAGNWRSQVLVAKPVATKGSYGVDDDGARILWSLQYAY